MKILFAGTPDIGVPSLQALAAEFSVVGILTSPDKAFGRGRRLMPSAVRTAGEVLGIPVLQPERLDSQARREVEALNPSLMVVFAYGRIFGPRFLGLFSQGAINMHPSALPQYRGPAPIAAVILAGATKTALTVQRVGLEVDSGDILRQTPFPLRGDETTESLSRKIAQAAAPELVAAVRAIEVGNTVDRRQNHDAATYCRLITKEDGIIDWKRDAVEIERLVRASIPWPKARTTLRGESLVILESAVLTPSFREGGGSPGTVLGVDKSQGILIQTGKGVLVIRQLQLAARKAMDFRSFLNGIILETGTKLGE